MKKMKNEMKIAILMAVAVILVFAYALLASPATLKEYGCTSSGGKVVTHQCCISTDDFPNTCLIGACGCSPDNSHYVNACLCPLGMCFDGQKCALR